MMKEKMDDSPLMPNFEFPPNLRITNIRRKPVNATAAMPTTTQTCARIKHTLRPLVQTHAPTLTHSHTHLIMSHIVLVSLTHETWSRVVLGQTQSVIIKSTEAASRETIDSCNLELTANPSSVGSRVGGSAEELTKDSELWKLQLRKLYPSVDVESAAKICK